MHLTKVVGPRHGDIEHEEAAEAETARRQTAEAKTWRPTGTGEVAITILHTNDIHQQLERLPHIATYVADYPTCA